jgi:uncharacterized protein YdeI (YjbR/CyaY-like superfamily)
MGKRSAEVDKYIAKAAPFARPILEKIREAFHAASPAVEETMKWSTPHFEKDGVLGSMAAFKQHVSWGFWKARLMKDPEGLIQPMGESGSMGALKLKDVSDLPSKKSMVAYVREAIRLNEEGITLPRPSRKPLAAPKVPPALKAALARSPKARATFEAFPPSHQREYIEWISEAKQEATRERRLATAIEWLSEGKPRNWKYMK